jgi:hypothetical protein
VRGGRELGQVEADLGEDDLSSTRADAGDLVQPLESGGAALITAAVVAVRFGNLLDELVDTGSQPIDLFAEHVDLIEEHASEFGMVLVEATGECLAQRRALRAHLPESEIGNGLRVPIAGD